MNTSSLKVLVTADWHVRQNRLDDIACVLDDLVEQAGVHRPDLILHGGDVFDTRQPTGELRARAALYLRELARIAPTIVVPGNHDGDSLKDWNLLAGGGLHIVTEPRWIDLHTCKVFALPWLTPRNVLEFGRSHESRLADFGRAVEMLLRLAAGRGRDQTAPHILLTHASVLGAQMGEHKPAVLGRDLVWPTTWLAGFDLVVLGHFHKAQTVRADPGQIVLYPGSPERLSFNERNEDKGFYVVTDQPSFYRLPARPMVQIEGDLRACLAVLEDTPSDAIVKLKLNLGPNEPVPHVENRWHTLKIEEVRPATERETRLEREAIGRDPLALLDEWLRIENVPDRERVLNKARGIVWEES